MTDLPPAESAGVGPEERAMLDILRMDVGKDKTCPARCRCRNEEPTSWELSDER